MISWQNVFDGLPVSRPLGQVPGGFFMHDVGQRMKASATSDYATRPAVGCRGPGRFAWRGCYSRLPGLWLRRLATSRA